MLDPNFDPLKTLQEVCKNQETMAKNIMEIAKAFNSQGDAVTEMAKVINKQDQAIRDLHSRLQLLEIARQYETTIDQK
jgi:hypothetical protein